MDLSGELVKLARQKLRYGYRDAMERIRLYAQLTNKPNRGEDLIHAYKAGFTDLDSALKPVQTERKQRIEC